MNKGTITKFLIKTTETMSFLVVGALLFMPIGSLITDIRNMGKNDSLFLILTIMILGSLLMLPLFLFLLSRIHQGHNYRKALVLLIILAVLTPFISVISDRF